MTMSSLMARVRRLPPWLFAIFAVVVTLSLISLLPARAGSEFTSVAGSDASFQAAPTFPAPSPTPTPTPTLERYPTAVLASGPVLYYRMNETGGTTAVDSAPAPNGTRPGSYYGSAQLHGNSGEPIGSSGVNFPSGSCITSQQNYNNQFAEGGPGSVPMGQSGTLEFLAKGAQGVSWFQTLVHAFRNNSDSLRLYVDANSVLQLQRVSSGGDATTNFNNYTFIYPTTWTHYVLTWANGYYTLYVNGTQVGDPIPLGWISPSAFINGADKCIGNYGITLFGDLFTGTLSNIAYYDRALPQTEISAHALAADIPQVPSGWTNITNVATGLVIDSGGQVPNSNNPGSNLKQWAASGSANFSWRFESLGDGYYRIFNNISRYYADILSPPTAGQRPVQAGWRGTTDTARQQWTMNSLGNGRYQIINRQSGLALDGHGTTQYLDNQAFVYVEPSDPSNPNQQWTIAAVP